MESTHPIAAAPDKVARMFPTTDAHQWVSITDSNGESWMFDLTFLSSGFSCIYGSGCQSILESSDEVVGCCAHGAHFSDELDRSETESHTSRLTSAQWQNHAAAAKLGGPFKKLSGGGEATRTYKGACIFLNRNGFAGGSGCALHIAATEADERPMDWKPDVCWQVPIRLEVMTDDNGHDTMLVKAWDRRDWGEGGIDFGWWCVEEEVAYSGQSPAYLAMEAELRELVGDELYEEFVRQAKSLLPTVAGTSVQIG